MSATTHPRPTVPNDVPELRDHLVEACRDGGPLARAMTVTQLTLDDHGEVKGRNIDDLTRVLMNWERDTLSRGDLWWFGDEMLALAEATMSTIPDDHVLDLDDLPSPQGVAVFARPHYGVDAQRTDPCRVDVLVWGPEMLQPDVVGGRDRPVPALGLTSWRAIDPDDHDLDAPDLTPIHDWLAADGSLDHDHVAPTDGRIARAMGGTVWVPLGRSDWPIGATVTDRLSSTPESVYRSVVDDRRFLTALMLIATQPGVATVDEHRPPRAVARRSERKGRSSRVRIVYLRRLPKTDTPDHDDVDDDGVVSKGVDWSCRWVVRPHFRSQPYGPGRTLRRTILVGPYVKGPDDKPLRTPVEVKAVVR